MAELDINLVLILAAMAGGYYIWRKAQEGAERAQNDALAFWKGLIGK